MSGKDDYDDLLRNIYRQDIYFQKINQVYDNGPLKGKKIADRKSDIYYYDLNDKFQKLYRTFLECLIKVRFDHKDCFKFMIVIHKRCLSDGKHYVHCRKKFIIRQVNFDRATFNRVIKELQEKNMLKVTKEDGFIFTPIMAPLVWNITEGEREEIKKEVERDIERLDDKWIKKITE